MFQTVDDNDGLKIAFGVDKKNTITHLFTGRSVNEKLKFFERAQTHQAILGAGLVAMISLIAGTLWGFPKWLQMGGGEKSARAALFFASVLNVAFFAMFASAIPSNEKELVFTGIPNLPVLLTMPVIGAALAVFAAVMAAPAWLNGYWSLFGRVRYTAFVALLPIFAWSLNDLHLFGPWYV
ncbi:MAG: hypothetical protein AAF224_03835 [Pseudomonadota bacterium]